MNNENYEKIRKAVSIQRLIMGIVVIIILWVAFWQNEGISRLIVLPFLICAIANFGEALFYYLKKDKIAKVFNYIFKISFLLFVVGFLGFFIYYAITKKEYLFLILILGFILITYFMLKDKLFKRKK